MAPSAKALEDALISGTYEVFLAEPDATSVNKVRKHVETKLGLEDGFFASADWKQKSKTVIKEYVEKALDGWVPEKTEPDTKPAVKRASSDAESPEPKRRKRATKPKKAPKEESDLSDLSEEETKPKKKVAPKGRKSKAMDSDMSEEEEKPRKKAASKKSKAKAPDSDEEVPDIRSDTSPERKPKAKPKAEDESEDEIKVSVKSTIESDEEKPKPATLDDSDADAKPTKEEDSKMAIDEEEEYSDVIDEPPKPKRKKKESKEPSSKPGKPAKAPKKAPTTSDDPNEAEIKKLQSHLIKCGVRKLWHNELKGYGDDSRAKIRHLKKMLADIGMDGRFSEAKAREIKEMRELMADAEAAQEMNELWGTGTGQRASRSKARVKSMKEESEGSEAEPMEGAKKEEDDDDDDDDEQDTFAARRRRAQADLAFLGDDSDSD